MGEIYHILNSNSALSFERYDTVQSKLSNSQNCTISSDLNLDFLKTDTHFPITIYHIQYSQIHLYQLYPSLHESHIAMQP